MAIPMQVRRYKPSEAHEIWDVFYGSTHHIVGQRYTSQQTKRWAPDDYDHSAWEAKLEQSNPFVAVEDDRIVGFAELLNGGEIDYFYCHHEFQRRGAGKALMHAVEAEAIECGYQKLTARVSLTAVDFFLSQDFRITGETDNVVCGTPAKQFLMAKRLAGGS